MTYLIVNINKYIGSAEFGGYFSHVVNDVFVQSVATRKKKEDSSIKDDVDPPRLYSLLFHHRRREKDSI